MTSEEQQSADVRSIDAELERLDIAHERVLQAMIAYMERNDPKFLDRLMDRLANPKKRPNATGSYGDFKDYAGEFLHAEKRLGETILPLSPSPQRNARISSTATDASDLGLDVTVSRQVSRICVSKTNGLWQVKVDGEFFGDFGQEDDAMTAVDMLSPCLR